MKRVFLAIAICSLFLSAVSAQENFPAVTIKSASGKDADFSKLMTQSGDTAIIVSFWATWCVPCITELDNINDQYKEWQAATPFKLLAISIDDSRTSQRVRPFVKGKGWVFDVYIDVNHDLKRALNINDVPHILVIKNNRVVYQHTGYIAGNEDELFAKIKAL
jgi:thiol-disulfide isomerase/thioredoxin